MIFCGCFERLRPAACCSGPVVYGALQTGLQDAQDHLRMFAFLFSNSQQHAAVRSGVLGKRLICLVRGVLLGIALAERLVDTGDARRFRPAGAGLFSGLEKIDRAELLRVAGLLPGHLAQHGLRLALHAAGEVRIERAVIAFVRNQFKQLFGRQGIGRSAAGAGLLSFFFPSTSPGIYLKREITKIRNIRITNTVPRPITVFMAAFSMFCASV